MQPCLTTTYCHVTMTSNFPVTLMSKCQMKKQDITYFPRSSVTHTIEDHNKAGDSFLEARAYRKNKNKCQKPGLNQRPLDLQSNTLPTEIFLQFTKLNYVAPLTIYMHVTHNFDTQNVHISQYGDRTHDPDQDQDPD
jgi:hypothetical protein